MLVAPIKAQTHLKPALKKENIAWVQLNSDSLMFYIQSWRNKESLYWIPIQFPSRLRFIWSLLWRGNKLHAFIKIVTDTFHNASRELVSYLVLKKHCWNNFCNINLFSGLLFTLCVFTLFLNPHLFLFLFLENLHYHRTLLIQTGGHDIKWGTSGLSIISQLFLKHNFGEMTVIRKLLWICRISVVEKVDITLLSSPGGVTLAGMGCTV